MNYFCICFRRFEEIFFFVLKFFGHFLVHNYFGQSWIFFFTNVFLRDSKLFIHFEEKKMSEIFLIPKKCHLFFGQNAWSTLKGSITVFFFHKPLFSWFWIFFFTFYRFWKFVFRNFSKSKKCQLFFKPVTFFVEVDNQKRFRESFFPISNNFRV